MTGKLADIVTIQPVQTEIAIIPEITVTPVIFLFCKDPSVTENRI